MDPTQFNTFRQQLQNQLKVIQDPLVNLHDHGYYNQVPTIMPTLMRFMGHIKMEDPTFDSHLYPWGFTKWLCDTDYFFEWYGLSENRWVRLAKMKLIGSAQLF